MPIPDLCILECVITGYECHYNAGLAVQPFWLYLKCSIDQAVQCYLGLALNTDGELPGLSLPNKRGSLLTLVAVLGSLNMPDVASCSHYSSVKCYDVINRLF